MKIIQTFWTAGQDPLKHGFGWTHPEYNLMSWALSCLSLREHYDEVELYTDSAGYHILIEVLQLPYTKTHVIFDDFQCLPHHWALSKIKTYSLQTEPFLHVDGDIYLPRPLPERVLTAPLVAQNREIGTMYYRRMMDAFLNHAGINVSDYLLDEWEKESIPSYNMGVFGGKDIEFIRLYCDEVVHLIKLNHLNDKTDQRSSANANVIFEQMLFAAISKREKRQVESILEEDINDTGYTASEFCNVRAWKKKALFHIVGGNKRVMDTFHSIEKTLFTLYYNYYKRITLLFPERHPYMETEMENQYALQSAKLLEVETFNDFHCKKNENSTFKKNPLIKILPYRKGSGRKEVFIPTLFSFGGKRICVSPLGMNILQILDKDKLSYRNISDVLHPYFTQNMKDVAETWIEKEIQYLLHHGAVYVY